MTKTSDGRQTGRLPLPASPSGLDMKSHMSRMDRVKAELAAEPKVSIRPMNDEIVIKNGYPMRIKAKERVAVPESIAQILENAERI